MKSCPHVNAVTDPEAQSQTPIAWLTPVGKTQISHKDQRVELPIQSLKSTHWHKWIYLLQEENQDLLLLHRPDNENTFHM